MTVEERNGHATVWAPFLICHLPVANANHYTQYSSNECHPQHHFHLTWCGRTIKRILAFSKKVFYWTLALGSLIYVIPRILLSNNCGEWWAKCLHSCRSSPRFSYSQKILLVNFLKIICSGILFFPELLKCFTEMSGKHWGNSVTFWNSCDPSISRRFLLPFLGLLC
jgi:hypothetical protein